MPRDVLPDQLTVPSRDDLVRRYERDWQLRAPGSAVGANTEPGIKARLIADAVYPLYGEAVRVAALVRLADRDEAQLATLLEELGLAARLPAVGSAGSVLVQASLGGGTLFADDQIFDEVTRQRWRVTVTAVYQNGQPVPVVGVDTGPATNLPAGRVLKWTTQRPGIGPTAVVFEQSDGSGLSGGRDVESLDEMRARISEAESDPALAGNDAAYRRQAGRTPGVALQAAFTFPGSPLPGVTSLAFTMRPARPGASRRPNETQIAAVRQSLVGRFPKDDGIVSLAVLAVPVDVVLRVRWARGGWTDAAAWPAYSASHKVRVASASSPTLFVLSTTNPSPVAPQVGQTFAVYDRTEGTFRRKRVASVVGANPWTVTCLTDNGVSDLSYTPAVDDIVSPWSDALDTLVAPIVAMIDATGPGELYADADLFDEGLRRKRSLPTPDVWPAEISDRNLAALYVPGASIVRLVEPALPHVVPPGTPGVSVNLFELGQIAVFPT